MLLAATLLLAGCEPRPGEVIEKWETSNGGMRVRVTAYAEGNPFHASKKGAHSSFESVPAGSENWRRFANTYLFDRRLPIPRENVRFVDDHVAYAFWQGWYRVTTDGGATWLAWDAATQLPGKIMDNNDLIQSVAVSRDGAGVMTLNPSAVRGGERVRLTTRDYGQHWSEQ